ncbi:MAG: UDP-N-acetylhexosamine pyrophosphorylase [Syntrophus sp. (in: bacteria)]|nr:UDP-N-acetylhexosamine pyrophosphorylase [Syntrophus sp. (in: bacteria)]
MKKEDLIELLATYGQQEIIEYCKGLKPHEEDLFFKNLEGLDLKVVFELHKQFSLQDCAVPPGQTIKPASIVPTPRINEEKEQEKKAKAAGKILLRDGKVAVLIVAGGQGSRLGFDGPKGIYPISPIKNKPLFQLFAEQVKALSGRYGTDIPLLIMTSDENHDDTIRFFEIHDHFGLGQETLHFFKQDMLPAITPGGKLALQTNTSLFTNPNGHGGSLKGLYDSGILDMLTETGITELFYCQVDNPLVKIADPVFLGYHTIAGADVSTKVVRRKSIEEKVGVYVSGRNGDAIIEYSDLSPEYMSALDDRGNILYWAGNTAIHLFSLPFVKRINDHGFALPYHCAKKRADITDRTGKLQNLDIWKFETFVFDAIPLAARTCCMEIERDEEFAPVKNKEGVDSPKTARSAMIALSKDWLRKAGVTVGSEVTIEISPFFALDEHELVQKMKDKKLAIETDTYFGE